MPAYNELKTISNQIKQFNEIVEKHTNFLKLCSGQPVIQAKENKRLDLNDNLNVIELKKEIKGIKDTYHGFPALVNPSVDNNFVSFTGIAGQQKDSGYKATDFSLVAHNHTKIINGNYELYIDSAETDETLMVKFRNNLTGKTYIVQLVEIGVSIERPDGNIERNGDRER